MTLGRKRATEHGIMETTPTGKRKMLEKKKQRDRILLRTQHSRKESGEKKYGQRTQQITK